MADPNKDRFEKRLKTLAQKTQPGKRIEKKVTEDGLVVDVVKSDRRALVPYKSILMAVVIFITLKGFIHAQIGAEEYQSRIEVLKRGHSVEVTAAFLLDADPATLAIAGVVSKVLR